MAFTANRPKIAALLSEFDEGWPVRMTAGRSGHKNDPGSAKIGEQAGACRTGHHSREEWDTMQPNDYYSLIVSAEGGHWDQGEGSTPKTRFHLCTVEPVTGRFSPMSDTVELSLKQFPAIFACERHAHPPTPAYVGCITKVEHRAVTYYLHFERDVSVDPITQERLLAMAEALDIHIPLKGLGDLDSSHWSVKQADLYRVLRRNGLVRTESSTDGATAISAGPLSTLDRLRDGGGAQPAVARPAAAAVQALGLPDGGSRRVFIVHGHNVGVREEVARFVSTLGLEPVILHEQANQGRTILTKFQDEAANAAFAIVLLTGDDRGGVATADPAHHQARARQNVVFEFGFFAGSLGLKHVCALVDGPLEKPSDIDGLVYVSLHADWKLQVAREMKAAGLPVDASRLI